MVDIYAGCGDDSKQWPSGNDARDFSLVMQLIQSNTLIHSS